MELNRRELLRSGALAAGALAFAPPALSEALTAAARRGASPYGPLQPPDANGVMLPPGFSSRIVARGLEATGPNGYTWPVFPDGQATFRAGDGGWILVTNSESLANTGAGTSAIRFGAGGEIADAYRILGATNVNCAGGPTPWGTWLSCEEADTGLVWECDPAGKLAAEARPALGAFVHEAAAVDPVGGRIYMTEDRPDGGFYRFTPANYPDLSAGRLEIAQLRGSGRVRWHPVPDPSTAQTGTPTRHQVAARTAFAGGEGIWYARGVCYFTTKADKRVWAYEVERGRLEAIFDRALSPESSLDAVDNVTVSATGDVLVCEDGGNMEIGLITPEHEVSPLIRFPGPEHTGSEVTGVVFDPSGSRLYCGSQRAYPADPDPGPGAVYEISGPFPRPRGGVPEDLIFGPPAGEVRPGGPLNPGADKVRPKVRLRAPKRIDSRAYLRRGMALELRLREAATVAIRHDTPDLARVAGRGGSTARPRSVLLARATTRVERGGAAVTVRLTPRRDARRRLARLGEGPIATRILISARDAAGNERVLSRRVEIA